MMSNFQLSFATHADLADAMVSLADEGKVIYAAMFYDDARALLKELAYFDEVTFGNLDIEDPQWGGYQREYYVYIDEEYKVGVEHAWREKEDDKRGIYLGAEGCIVLVHSDANSRIIEAMKGSDCTEFDIDAEAECDGCCETCAMFDDDDDDDDDYIEVDLEDLIEKSGVDIAKILAAAVFLGDMTE